MSQNQDWAQIYVQKEQRKKNGIYQIPISLGAA